MISSVAGDGGLRWVISDQTGGKCGGNWTAELMTHTKFRWCSGTAGNQSRSDPKFPWPSRQDIR